MPSQEVLIQFQVPMNYKTWKKFEKQLLEVFKSTDTITGHDLFRVTPTSKSYKLQTTQFGDNSRKDLARKIHGICEEHELSCQIFRGRHHSYELWRIK